MERRIEQRTESAIHAAAGAATAVALQVVLSRVFSVILWYHLGFFCISIAMLGGAIGAILVERRRGPPFNPSTALALASALLTLAMIVVVRIPIEAQGLLERPSEALRFLLLTAVIAAPFVALGIVVANAIARAPDDPARVYAGSFFGGAIGALFGYLAMDRFGAPFALGFVALLPLLPLLRRPATLLLGPGACAAILAAAVLLRPDTLLPMGSAKHFPKLPAASILSEKWNAFSRVTFYDNPERHGLWELPAGLNVPLPRSIGIAIDAWAITSILEVHGPLDLAFMRNYPPTLGYVGAKEGFTTLVIGAGGGVDVHAALFFGAAKVDAVEINPLIVSALLEDHRGFAGDLYRDPRVEPIVAEGRHFVESTARRYDRIVLTGVDTFAATEAGAFALSENFLYTVEAVGAYLDKLSPDGRLVFTRWWFEPERQTTRLYLTILDALRGRGVAQPEEHVFVAHTSMNSLVIVKAEPFTLAEVEQLSSELPARGLVPAWAPGRAPQHPNFGASELATSSVARANYAYDIEPTTDDRPFFFENSRLSQLFRAEGDWIHDRLGGLEIIVVTLLSSLLLALPLLFVGRGANSPSAAAQSGLWLVACLVVGVAYVMIEAAMLPQLSRLLGHPSKAVSVVLVAMLFFSGLGALAARSVPSDRGARTVFAVAILTSAILGFGSIELADSLVGVVDTPRILATLLLLALPSFAMGFPLPLLLRSAPSDGNGMLRGLAWNGVGSAIGGPLAALLALSVGFQATLLCAAAAYLLGAAALEIARRSTTPTT